MGKKEQTRALIVETAQEVFLTKGLFQTVMDDIAKAADITRRTLYRHFETKEDIAFEVAIALLTDWNQTQETFAREARGTGLDQVIGFLMASIDHMEDKRDILAYLGAFDFYFQDSQTAMPTKENLDRFNKVILVSDQLMKAMLDQGIRDGSIKETTDVALMVPTMSHVLWSFGQRIAIRADHIQEESGIPAVDLIRQQVLLYKQVLEA